MIFAGFQEYFCFYQYSSIVTASYHIASQQLGFQRKAESIGGVKAREIMNHLKDRATVFQSSTHYFKEIFRSF